MIQIFRPELPAAAGICVAAGQVLAAGRLPDWKSILLGFVCGFALSAAALILNDYFDYEVDLINHPNRPLPSGAVTRGEVIGLTAVTTLVGLAAALRLGLPAFIIGIIFWVIGVLYNWRYKEAGLIGNLMVAASVSVTFILGAVTMKAPWSSLAWTFALMAFLIDLGEEIAGDAMDMEGDRKRGVRSIALLKGRQYALKISLVMWAGMLLLNLLPALLGWLPAGYLVIAVLTGMVVIFFSIKLYQSQTPPDGRRAMRGVYLTAMLGITLGVVILLLGSLRL